jgi:hypothetical protein
MGNSHNEIRGFMGNLPIPSHNPLWEGIHGKFPKALMGISHEIWVNLLRIFQLLGSRAGVLILESE